MAKFLTASILKNISANGCFWKRVFSWNWKKLKIIIRNFNLTFKKQVSQHRYQKKVKMFVFILWLVSHEVCVHIQYFFDVLRNKVQEIRSKVQEKNMSCERVLNFDQWKTFSENYKPMRVWLWLAYKFTKNYFHLRLFPEFIQT